METQSLSQKISTGWRLGKIAFVFIENHKKILFFNFLSGILYAITGLFFLALIIENSALRLAFSSQSFHSSSSLLCFLFLFISITSSVITKVALSFYTAQLFEGKPASIRASFVRSFHRLQTIIGWAFFDATIGTFLSALRSEKKGLSMSILALILKTTISISWSIISFFVVPLIALQDYGLIDTIKCSTETMKKTWGETIGATFNVNLIGALFITLWYTLFFGSLYLIITYAQPHPLPTQNILFIGILGITGIIIPLFVVMLIMTTVTTILKTALFNYTQNKPTGPFDKQLLKNSFIEKKNITASII